ncbi:PIG-L family deacetylase [uncultured Jatrophihabitans sp.]|uniref:PIG-L family deacetylase n=1 Tax=uncultured Jatrophihabitans sp. TaxID=1610747 RepID=UPI0035CA48C9
MTRPYDHLAPGTPARAWDALVDAAAELAAPSAGDRVVVLAAHPDDETLGAGGLLASCARRGVDVAVVVATDGEASHPRSTTHRPAELAAIRRREVTAAVALLAPRAQLSFLGLPDGGLDAARGALRARLDDLAAGASHLVSPWFGDRHPDHDAVGAAAAHVAERHGARHWQYPIWFWHWASPGRDELPLGRLRGLALAEDDLRAKRAAIEQHVSQHSPLSPLPGDEAILPAPLLAHFDRDREVFVVAEPLDAADAGYFDALYAGDDDPWRLQERFYEQRKREVTLAALPRRRFRRAFEPGCATGLLTARLAERCDEVLGWDVSERALELARRRIADADGARVELGQIPAHWPSGEFDLVLLSEVGYYCRDLDLLADRVLAGLSADGVVLGCHWRRPATDHPHTAEAVHQVFDRRLATVVDHVEADFLLRVWSRTGRSVAAEGGIVA